MFGLIISGRPVNASPEALSETQYAFRIPPTPSFSHIVVFLLPATALPPHLAVTVHIQIPPSQDFKLLGGIGPGKESAIFKVSGIKAVHGSSMVGAADDVDLMTDDASANPASTNGFPNSAGSGTEGDILVGLSLEPATQVEAQLRALQSGQQSAPRPSSALVRMASEPASSKAVTTKVLAQRIIGNAFNFLASFGSDTVPLRAFEEWWRKFEKRVELDPGFLEKEVEG